MQPITHALTGLLLICASFSASAAERKSERPEQPTVHEVSPPLQAAEIDPFAIYDGELVFDVYRKGKHVGEHHVAFSRDGGKLIVDARFHIKVSVFVFSYDFDYESREVWNGGALESVTSKVNDNGKRTDVHGVVEEGFFKIDSTRRQAVTTHWIFPTNHWNKAQVGGNTILSTLNGRVMKVDVVQRGIEAVQTQQGQVDAERFEYTGDLHDTEVWYDAMGRWVHMRFKAKDGSLIEHVCRQCGLGRTAQLQ